MEKYSRDQVIDILKLTAEKPEEILKKWEINRDNTKLDLSKYKYQFVFTFPIIVNNEKVAEVTLVELKYTGIDYLESFLMGKYFTTEIYENLYGAFSPETYLHMFLHAIKPIQLPEIKKGFFAYESSFLDNKGNDIRYTISYGYPKSKKNLDVYYKCISKIGDYDLYRFSDPYIYIQIEKKKIKGGSLGKEINKRIAHRRKNSIK